jgi:hypothetical protein
VQHKTFVIKVAYFVYDSKVFDVSPPIFNMPVLPVKPGYDAKYKIMTHVGEILLSDFG